MPLTNPVMRSTDRAALRRFAASTAGNEQSNFSLNGFIDDGIAWAQFAGRIAHLFHALAAITIGTSPVSCASTATNTVALSE